MIRVNIEESEKKGSEFPKLMRDGINGSVVLVLGSAGAAFVISGTKGDFYYENSYPMDRLEDFHGEITLRSE